MDWLQFFLYLVLLVASTPIMGRHLFQVLDADGKTFLDPIVKPFENLTYRIIGVNPRHEQTWQRYSIAMLVFSAVTMLFTYAILRLQFYFPLNPEKLSGVIDHLAFNTAASFTTNTNWQSYAGETTMSYFSQMVALTSHNFWSAAVGIAVAAALVRGIARNNSSTVGNFWTDLVRTTYYLLLPISFIFAIFLISQGVIQNFHPYQEVPLTEPVKITVEKKDDAGNTIKDARGNALTEEQTIATQRIVQGPMASQVAIKMLGTNGGGYTNANASHGYENPTPLSNFIQMFSIFLIPSGLTFYLGLMVKSRRHGWAVWSAMASLFIAGFLICWWAEQAGNPQVTALGVNAADGNMEGKEVRFGIMNSALFATITTDASCGAVNCMHDSFTPIGGLVPLMNIQLGEIVFGGVGAGLYGMLVFVVLAVFIAGLMIGRTPEYLGKKIEPYDVKVASLAILVVNFAILGFAGWAAVSDWGLAGRNNMGPHGLSEIFYAYSSAAGNNGSAFAGLTTSTYWYDTTMAITMLLGRFIMILPIMALAGSLAKKKIIPAGPGSFPVWGTTFTLLLISTILLVGALTYLPGLALGPILEHFLMHANRTF